MPIITHHDAPQEEMDLGETIHIKLFLQEKRDQELREERERDLWVEVRKVIQEVYREAEKAVKNPNTKDIAQIIGELIEPILEAYKDILESKN